MDQKELIAQLIIELSKTIKYHMRKNFGDEDAGITMPQHMVIGMLFHHKELKISELSRHLGLSNSTVSGIVDRLERQRIVERIRGTEDRRVVRVRLTPQFAEKHQGLHKTLEGHLRKLLDSATPKEADKIAEGLTILKKILDDGTFDHS